MVVFMLGLLNDFFRMINIPSEKFPEKSKELEGKLKGYDITYDFKEFINLFTTVFIGVASLICFSNSSKSGYQFPSPYSSS